MEGVHQTRNRSNTFMDAVPERAMNPVTGAQLATDVTVDIDGIPHTVKAGEKILVNKGESISLRPYVAHIFGPEAGSGDLVVGEVSMVNDDTADNFFLEKTSRFAEIEEDEPILHPLCNEYDRVL